MPITEYSGIGDVSIEWYVVIKTSFMGEKQVNQRWQSVKIHKLMTSPIRNIKKTKETDV